MNANPFKGFSRTTAMLAGTGNDTCRSPAFTDSIESYCKTTLRPSNPDSEAAARSAKFLLINSSNGNWVRLMRCAVKSYGRTLLAAVLLEQRRHFFVRDGCYFFVRNCHYCTTKLVNRMSSTSPPPCFFCTARTSASASSRSFSLPSRDIIVW